VTRTILQRTGLVGEVPVYQYKGTEIVAFDEIPQNQWVEFGVWLRGSTLPSFPELGTVFYADDYERFLAGLANDD